MPSCCCVQCEPMHSEASRRQGHTLSATLPSCGGWEADGMAWPGGTCCSVVDTGSKLPMAAPGRAHSCFVCSQDSEHSTIIYLTDHIVYLSKTYYDTTSMLQACWPVMPVMCKASVSFQRLVVTPLAVACGATLNAQECLCTHALIIYESLTKCLIQGISVNGLLGRRGSYPAACARPLLR